MLMGTYVCVCAHHSNVLKLYTDAAPSLKTLPHVYFWLLSVKLEVDFIYSFSSLQFCKSYSRPTKANISTSKF